MSFPLLLIFGYAFLIVTGILLLYYLFFFTRLAFYKDKKEYTGELPALTVLIRSQNELSQFRLYLEKVLQQAYIREEDGAVNFGVDVINNETNEDCFFYFRELKEKYPFFRFIDIPQEVKGISRKKYALTIGLKGAENEIIALSNFNSGPGSQHWLAEMGKHLEEGVDLVLGYNSYGQKAGLLNRFMRYENYFRGLQFLSFGLAGLPYEGVDQNLVCRRSLFFKHRSYLSEQHSFSEGIELFVNASANRKNTRVALAADAITFSTPERNWESWFRERKRRTRAIKHYRLVHKLLLGLFAISMILYYPLFVVSLFNDSPWKYYFLIVFGGKLILQTVLWILSMKKLGEKGLMGYFLFFEVFLCLLYIRLIPTLLFKSRKSWN